MIVAGIDPGIGGGVAVLDPEYWMLRVVSKMPTCTIGKKKMVDAPKLLDLLVEANAKIAVVEQSGSQPTDSAHRAFLFGRNYGTALAAAQCAVGPEVKLVSPVRWKRALGLLKQDKKASVDRAKFLFPIDADRFVGPQGGTMDGPAEAALLAYWYWETHMKGDFREVTEQLSKQPRDNHEGADAALCGGGDASAS